MMNNIPPRSFVITIESLEESIVSAQRTISSGQEYGFEKVEMFGAVTPRTHDVFKEFKENGIPERKFDCISTKKESVMGCFLSHFFLWKKCIKLNGPILILEHDAVFNGSFPNNSIPEFRGILSIGAPSYGKFKVPNEKGVGILTSKQYLPGAHGYYIKPDAAKDLVEQAKILPRPVDVFIHLRTFPWIQEYYPWLVHVEETYSTVQTNGKSCTPKHGYQKDPHNYRIIDL